jgi:hypothetical protein
MVDAVVELRERAMAERLGLPYAPDATADRTPESRGVAEWMRRIRSQGRRIDVAVMERTARWVIRAYDMGTSFVWAHLLGCVSEERFTARRAVCESCSHRHNNGGVQRCYGANHGKGCGCSESRWWFFSRLDWMLRLRNRPCPMGKFGRFDRASKRLRS